MKKRIAKKEKKFSIFTAMPLFIRGYNDARKYMQPVHIKILVDEFYKNSCWAWERYLLEEEKKLEELNRQKLKLDGMRDSLNGCVKAKNEITEINSKEDIKTEEFRMRKRINKYELAESQKRGEIENCKNQIDETKAALKLSRLKVTLKLKEIKHFSSQKLHFYLGAYNRFSEVPVEADSYSELPKLKFDNIEIDELIGGKEDAV